MNDSEFVLLITPPFPFEVPDVIITLSKLAVTVSLSVIITEPPLSFEPAFSIVRFLTVKSVSF